MSHFRRQKSKAWKNMSFLRIRAAVWNDRSEGVTALKHLHALITSSVEANRPRLRGFIFLCSKHKLPH